MNGHARKATNQEKHPTVTMMRYVWSMKHFFTVYIYTHTHQFMNPLLIELEWASRGFWVSCFSRTRGRRHSKHVKTEGGSGKQIDIDWKSRLASRARHRIRWNRKTLRFRACEDANKAARLQAGLMPFMPDVSASHGLKTLKSCAANTIPDFSSIPDMTRHELHLKGEIGAWEWRPSFAVRDSARSGGRCVQVSRVFFFGFEYFDFVGRCWKLWVCLSFRRSVDGRTFVRVLCQSWSRTPHLSDLLWCDWYWLKFEILGVWCFVLARHLCLSCWTIAERMMSWHIVRYTVMQHPEACSTLCLGRNSRGVQCRAVEL